MLYYTIVEIFFCLPNHFKTEEKIIYIYNLSFMIFYKNAFSFSVNAKTVFREVWLLETWALAYDVCNFSINSGEFFFVAVFWYILTYPHSAQSCIYHTSNHMRASVRLEGLKTANCLYLIKLQHFSVSYKIINVSNISI